jgi:hypothetical protein
MPHDEFTVMFVLIKGIMSFSFVSIVHGKCCHAEYTYIGVMAFNTSSSSDSTKCFNSVHLNGGEYNFSSIVVLGQFEYAVEMCTNAYKMEYDYFKYI